MAAAQENPEYFSELLKPLTTNEILEDMFKKLKEEIISKFEEIIDEQNREIDELEGKIAIQANTIHQLMIKSNDNEQYSRRSCLRIHGTECSNDERNVLQRVKECYEELNLPFQDENIDSVHRIGKTYTDKNTEKKVQSIIVKFNSWKSRQQFYNARPKHFTNSKRKPGHHLFSVLVDLTRRRYLLLNKAKGLIKDCESINYVLADVNCSLRTKFQNGVFKYFNSENELHCLINN